MARAGFPTRTWRPFLLDARCRTPRATHPDSRPGNRPERVSPFRCPYSVLLPMGLAVPPPLPASAVGSYPTISPFPRRVAGVCFLWRFPLGWRPHLLKGRPVSPAGHYPASCFHGARTFLRRALSSPATAAARPAGMSPIGRQAAGVKQCREFSATPLPDPPEFRRIRMHGRLFIATGRQAPIRAATGKYS